MGKGGAIRWTPEMLAAYEQRTKQTLATPIPAQPRIQAEPAKTGTQKLQALGRLRDGSMNKTEAAFAERLALQKHAGEVLWWSFEAVKLRLADNTHLTVDFAVLTSAGELQMIDVKGARAIVQDDAHVKMKVAAEKFPFAFFYAFPVKGGGWTVEKI